MFILPVKRFLWLTSFQSILLWLWVKIVSVKAASCFDCGVWKEMTIGQLYWWWCWFVQLFMVCLMWNVKWPECPSQCSRRCSKTQYHKPCMFFCQKCCRKCLCVPPGYYGNKAVCPCYNNWKTKEGGPKCPWASNFINNLLYNNFPSLCPLYLSASLVFLFFSLS